MKVGDLVKWSFSEQCYHNAFHDDKTLPEYRKCGIIVDKNEKYNFVYWVNGELIAQAEGSLELAGASR